MKMKNVIALRNSQEFPGPKALKSSRFLGARSITTKPACLFLQESGRQSQNTRLLHYVRNDNGMTLLEIAISMAILAIALVALANLFPIGLKASRRAVNYSSASILAQRVIENMKRAASVYDIGDEGDVSSSVAADVSNAIDEGYFELVVWDTGPYSDAEANIRPLTPIASQDQYHQTAWEYEYPNMDIHAVVTKEAIDKDKSGTITSSEIEQKKQLQKIYVAVYWTEADRDRAETFITYISNPFYERYR
jgi:prepilin-type N-terminal cleavage/methylation domain-containing protein